MMRALSKFAQAVLLYARLKFKLFPLAPGSKVPHKGSRGFLDAVVPDEALAARIWSVDPPPNVGWALPEGVIVLDFDRPGGAAELERQGFELPETVSQITPRGEHYAYRTDRPLTQCTRILPDVDVRVGGKGYILVPPSIVDGKRYAWVNSPEDTDIAQAPQWVYSLFEGGREAGPAEEDTPRSGSEIDRVLLGLKVGERNDGAFRYLSRLRRLGLERREARVLLQHLVSLAQQVPGNRFELKEAERILDNVWGRYTPGSPSIQPLDRSLRAVVGSEFIELEIPPRMELLGDLLLEKHLALLHAKRGVGKTWCALAIALAVATGESFLRWKAPRPRRVVYLDGEMPASDLQFRVRALSREGSGHLLSNLVMVASDLQDSAIPSLNSRDAQALVEEHLGDTALVVLDSHSTLIGGEENDAAAFQGVMDWLLRLRRQGVSVLLVHHSGKGGEQRGSSRREDPMDVSIDLRHPVDYEPTEFGRFELHFRKTRGVIDASPLLVDIEQDHDGRLSLKWSPLTDRQRVQARALKGQGLSKADIARELGVNRSTIGRWFEGGR